MGKGYGIMMKIFSLLLILLTGCSFPYSSSQLEQLKEFSPEQLEAIKKEFNVWSCFYIAGGPPVSARKIVIITPKTGIQDPSFRFLNDCQIDNR
jgi:hypothetical protein